MFKALQIFFCVSLLAGFAMATNIGGKWDVRAQAPNGREMKLELNITQAPDKITGTLGSERGVVDISEAKFEGSDLIFKIMVEGAYTIKCTVNGDTMKGTWTAPDGSSGPVTASRAGAAAASVSGKWKLVANRSGGGEHNVEFEIKDHAGQLTGALLAEGMSMPLQELKLEGQELSFKISSPNGVYALKMSVAEKGMKGTYTGPDSEAGSVTATR